MPPKPKTEALLKQAIELHSKSQYQELIDLLNDKVLAEHKSIELTKQRAVAHNDRGVSLYNAKEHNKALEDYNKAIELDPTLAIAYQNRSLVWESMQQLDNALADCSKLIELEPENASAWYNRANIWYSKNEMDRALEDYNKAIDLNPAFVDAYNNRGNTLYNKNELDRAIEDYNKAISMDPAYVSAYYNRANALFNKNKLDEAIADYNEAIKLRPQDPFAWYSRGNAWYNKKEYDKAYDDYATAIKHKPGYVDAYNNQGNVWFNKNEPDKAIASYTEAIKLDPDYANAYYNRGNVWNNKSEYEKAKADYEKAKELSGNYSYLLDVINELKLKIGEKPVVETGADDSTRFIADVLEKITDRTKRESIKQVAVKFIEQINKIRKYSIITEPCPVAHYTKLWVADRLVVPDGATKLRYSNVSNMNDPEEGKILKEILLSKDGMPALKQYFEETNIFGKGDPTDKNVYLGSFLPASQTEEERRDTHEDELVMWRTYGKDEERNEAAGCSIVINNDFFLWPPVDSKPNPLQSAAGQVMEKQVNPVTQPGEVLYRVLYFNKATGFIERRSEKLDKVNKAIDSLRSILNELLTKRAETGEKENTDSIISRGLAELRYFFKSSNYSFENEYRVIQYYNDDNELVLFDKQSSSIPRVLYVESTKPIKASINRIYLGPKVPHPERWMYLELALKRDMLTKSKTVRVIPSSCKFQ